MEPCETRYYRIAPQFQRCCWIVLAVTPVFVVLAYWQAIVMLNRAWGNFIGLCGIFGAIALAMTVPLLWRIRVDDEGIARRILFAWSIWRWEEIASGRIKKRYPLTLYDPSRPWGWRSMRLEFLANEELAEVAEAINKHYRLPPPPELVDSLTIKQGLRTVITFDAVGIHIEKKESSRHWKWKEIELLHILRIDQVRRDFKKLELTLPDEELTLELVSHQGGTSPTWREATAEEVSVFLLERVPKDRVSESAYGIPESNPRVLQKSLVQIEKNGRLLRRMISGFLFVFLTLIVWFAFNHGWVAAIGMFVTTCLPLILASWAMSSIQARQLRKAREALRIRDDAHYSYPREAL